MDSTLYWLPRNTTLWKSIPKIFACSFVRATTSSCSHICETSVARAHAWRIARQRWWEEGTDSLDPFGFEPGSLRGDDPPPPDAHRLSVLAENLGTLLLSTAEMHDSKVQKTSNLQFV